MDWLMINIRIFHDDTMNEFYASDIERNIHIHGGFDLYVVTEYH